VLVSNFQTFRSCDARHGHVRVERDHLLGVGGNARADRLRFLRHVGEARVVGEMRECCDAVGGDQRGQHSSAARFSETMRRGGDSCEKIVPLSLAGCVRDASHERCAERTR
jgi:hypothetical protein